MNYYTADPHLGHANILKYCMRLQFLNRREKYVLLQGGVDKARKLKISDASLKKHNEGIIRNWNERVKENDTVIVHGDFCFRNTAGGKQGEGVRVSADEWIKRLNGRIVFIKGNHDRNNSCKTIIESLVIKIGGRKIFCVHKPEHCNTDYEINFVGHVHTAWKFKQYYRDGKVIDLINVGVDQWNYRPVTYPEIMKQYNWWVKQGRPNG
jgi:calcineurin-like phosphoesterase family protein